MSTILARYQTVLRIYDNGGKTFDRYTIIPPGARLGRRIAWSALPAGVQRFAREYFPEYAPC